jgi:hypothetical protein
MKAIGKFIVVFVAALLMPAGLFSADSQPPAVGGVLPEFALPVPKTDAHRNYLGVVGKDSFTIPEIKADIVIVQIFSIY